jgi:hypothetical protein
MNWQLSYRADPIARQIADRHYNRQKIGHPQFVPPGRCLVLLGIDGVSLWVTSWPFAEHVKHDWAGAWINSCFRRESGPVASDLIREALAATASFWTDAPRIGCKHCGETVCMVTFIDASKVKRKRDPGRCYIKAGFRRCTATTQGGLVVVHIGPENMPQKMAAQVWQTRFEFLFNEKSHAERGSGAAGSTHYRS